MVLVHVNNFWLVLGMAFKIYSGSKGLIKTSCKKSWRANSYVWGSYWGKTGTTAFLSPPILNWVKDKPFDPNDGISAQCEPPTPLIYRGIGSFEKS